MLMRALLLLCVTLAACGQTAKPTPEDAFLDELQERTFRYFWETTHPETGLAPDRWPTESFASIAATGFALTAYPIGAEHGWVTRAEAATRTRDTLRFLYEAPQDSAVSGSIGYKGFFYHFLHIENGERFEKVELSTVDTALLLAGAFFAQSYFDGGDATEREIRELADQLYARVDWNWASVRAPLIGHGWDPEKGHLPYDWRGYNEAMLVYLFALASPTHPVGPDAWDAWLEGYKWGEFEGREQLGFAPLFGHQYSHVWVDFRGIQDAFTRGKGIDYFENSRRATLSQRDYAIRNPGGFAAYGEDFWGLTACDGPVHGTYDIDGVRREFQTYWARGASFPYVNDDGTVAPTAAGGSIAFAPEVVVPTLLSMRQTYGAHLWGEYGFLDALNPTFTVEVPVQHGRVDPTLGWVDGDYLGIDQGPILAMIENHRSELIWRTLRTNEHLRRGLEKAGFEGGWLEAEGHR